MSRYPSKLYRRKMIEHNSSIKYEPILMKLYTVVVYVPKICMQEDKTDQGK